MKRASLQRIEHQMATRKREVWQKRAPMRKASRLYEQADQHPAYHDTLTITFLEGKPNGSALSLMCAMLRDVPQIMLVITKRGKLVCRYNLHAAHPSPRVGRTLVLHNDGSVDVSYVPQKMSLLGDLQTELRAFMTRFAQFTPWIQGIEL